MGHKPCNAWVPHPDLQTDYFYSVWEFPIYGLMGLAGGVAGAAMVTLAVRSLLFTRTWLPPCTYSSGLPHTCACPCAACP